MKQWAKTIGSGILALASLGALAWAAPQLHGNDAGNTRTNFAGKLPIHELRSKKGSELDIASITATMRARARCNASTSGEGPVGWGGAAPPPGQPQPFMHLYAAVQ